MKKETAPNFVQMEENILSFWQQNQSFEALKTQNKQKNEKRVKNGEAPKYFSFLDGPVTANYKMGLHHAWNRALKDIMLRYNAMQGCEAHFQNGFDSHGLPVELRVEKEVGLNSKKDIEQYGMQNFIEKCMDTVDFYANLMTESSVRLGQWMNWDDSYFTNSDENITSIWHFLKVCHEKGWLVEKYRSTPWCTRCGTALSEHEMSDADAYKDVEHTAVFFKCPIVNNNRFQTLLLTEGQITDKEACLVVWTTTPWTLSSNVAVAVNPELTYSFCKSKTDSRLLIIGKDALKIAKGDAVPLFEVKGSELAGLEYETCFPEIVQQNFAHVVVPWNKVGATEGSGMVHIAPGCGQEDFELGEKLGLNKIVPIDEAGNFAEGFSFYSGKNAGEVADEVFEQLKKQNKMYYTHLYKHRYPHCWRCKNSLVFRLVKDWVIKMDDVRPALIAAIEKVEFQPEFMKKRMLDWLINMGDWSISRKRYYGVPLPFYTCEDCGHVTVIGSLSELQKKATKKFTYGNKEADLPHLHKPYIDNVQIQCEKCGKNAARIPEVGDCWLDAGITPFSTKKYFTDKKFWKQNFVSDVVLEGREQIRLWFYSLLVMAVTLENEPPYKKIICTAMLLDRDGNKLSKSSPNNIPLEDAFNLFGADAIRYLFASNNMLADVRFSREIADEVRRKLLAFWNSYVFFNTYASIDKVDEEWVDGKKNPLFIGEKMDENSIDKTDVWLIQKSNCFMEVCRKYYENQQFSLVCEEFEKLSDELSNWYVRINRKRFWGDAGLASRKAAYRTLYLVLKDMITVMAPTTPFMCEHIWQNMVRPVGQSEKASVFLADFPSKHTAELWHRKQFDHLAKQTEVTREIISLGGRLRSENNLKVKQPLAKMFLIVSGEEEEAARMFADVMKDELNIKEIVFEKDMHKFNTAVLSLDFRKAGAVLKGDAQKLKNSLAEMDEKAMADLVKKVTAGGVFSACGLDGLTSDMFILSYKAKEGFVIVTENGKTVVLDTHITEELKNQGLLRELIHSIQNLRKEMNLKIEQRILLHLQTDNMPFADFLQLNESEIKKSTLAKELTWMKSDEESASTVKLELSDGVTVWTKILGQ